MGSPICNWLELFSSHSWSKKKMVTSIYFQWCSHISPLLKLREPGLEWLSVWLFLRGSTNKPLQETRVTLSSHHGFFGFLAVEKRDGGGEGGATLLAYNTLTLTTRPKQYLITAWQAWDPCLISIPSAQSPSLHSKKYEKSSFVARYAVHCGIEHML